MNILGTIKSKRGFVNDIHVTVTYICVTITNCMNIAKIRVFITTIRCTLTYLIFTSIHDIIKKYPKLLVLLFEMTSSNT